MTRALAVLLLALAALLVAVDRSAPSSTRPSTRPWQVRALGPFADLAAAVEWVRFQVGLRDGDLPRALEHGENALALRPEDTAGWDLLASVLFERTSPARTPDADERLRWLRAAVGLTRRGEAVARDPGALAFSRALLLLRHAEEDPATRFPGGEAGLLRAARESLDRAVALGDPRAADLRAALAD